MKHTYLLFLGILIAVGSMRIWGYYQLETTHRSQTRPVPSLTQAKKDIPLVHSPQPQDQTPYLHWKFLELSGYGYERGVNPVFNHLLMYCYWGENSIQAGQKTFDQIKDHLDFAVRHNVTPIVNLEPFSWVESGKKNFSLDSILAGESDAFLEGWSNALALWQHDHPDTEVVIRLMHEMNAPMADYHWAREPSEKYKRAFTYIYNHIASVNPHVAWMLVFQNLTADANWQNKRATDYQQYIPKGIQFEYIGIDGYSRPYLHSKEGPTGGEVTPQQVLPEAFFTQMRQRFPQTRITISETSVPYMEATTELIPYPVGSQVRYLKDAQRAAWIQDLTQYVLYLDATYDIYELTWFNANTDYHWSLEAPEDTQTLDAFYQMVETLNSNQIKVGIFPG